MTCYTMSWDQLHENNRPKGSTERESHRVLREKPAVVVSVADVRGVRVQRSWDSWV